MKNKVFTAHDNTRLMCAVWDDVKNPIGVVQIIHGIFDCMATYDKLAHFLNKNGYIVFGIDRTLSRTPQTFERTTAHTGEIIQHLRTKYMLPLFIIGYGYGGFVAQSVMQISDIPANAVCLIKSGKHYRWALRFAHKFAQICARIFGANRPAKLINFLRRRHCGHTQTTPLATYGFYVSLLDGLIKLDAESKFENPILIISAEHDYDAPNPRLSHALYNAYHDNDLTNTTLMIYPDMQKKLLLEMNCGAVGGDILSFFNDTNLLLQSDTSAYENGTIFCKSDAAI